MSKSSYLTADLDYILKDCDLDKVRHTIEATPGYAELPFPDQQEVSELCWLAAESFLARDLQEFSQIRVEEKAGNGRAIIDLQGLISGTLAPYTEHVGHWDIIDWKTTSMPVDTDQWRRKCLDSWQWKFYGALRPEAKFFTYRGISRERAIRTEGEGWGEAQRVREVRLELNDGLPYEVAMQKAGVLGSYNALIKLTAGGEIPVWPRNTKTGCYAYGIKCPFKNDCDTNSMPLGGLGLEPLDDISYSRMENFMLCPERARRTKLAELEDLERRESDATTVGVAFHAGIAELYIQAFGERVTTLK